MYPMAFMCFAPSTGDHLVSFPHVLLSSGNPPVPNPILEPQPVQRFIPFPRIPILAEASLHTALNPSLLQYCPNEPADPLSDFQVLRPSEVARYCPSAMSEYREEASLLTATKLICWSILIPRQILENGVLQ